MLDGIRDAVRKFLGGNTSYEVAVEEFIKDIQKALISSDVQVKLVFSLTNKIKERLKKETPPSNLERREWFIKIVYDELSALFGGDKEPEVNPKSIPWVIMLVGVQGTGKTTTAGKLAYFYKKRGYKVALVGADVYRPAALEQLQQIGKQINVPVYGEPGSQDAVGIAKRGVEKFLSERYELVIVDTAGRHGYGEEVKLLEEMKDIYEKIKPNEVILVIDASLGQKAYDLAKRFHEASNVGSIIITKMDGTAKGGGALSAVAATGAPIKFIGVGEKIDELEVFNPRRFVARILGMGDLEAIIEKMKAMEDYEGIQKKMGEVMTGKSKLTLRDMYKQIVAVRKMGPLSKILQLIPGMNMMGDIPEDQVKVGEQKMQRWLSIMNSMTYQELDNPSIIDKQRMRRIAMGSGTEVEEVRELIEHFNTVQRTLKMLKRRKKDVEKLFGQMGG
ncbi:MULTISPECIES: signal recognition particle protein Srp54 [Metallosphaera]|uniref:Signal recognition particle 54 kDa protein n=3 Tax=Metallosphaera TaxID=41980 RepID=SRP54_METS5|nr:MULTISPECIES: signal recognition particle protein Srp54 [Metallosphaera]A4YHL0.1 RecName: Full=Signal recognition particle 54 kDa protein; Short=SRP54 [Metallosphaera sedula DSM 5348]ABP95912.1 signal recognition particle subunit FFH/SRP54 (srp54) [Metallosphaera sedula DSM 5348]AIM27896.1 signal recognition particle subunit FFH/SRP54 (srp54) [Metallosphaera sedula]AKV74733.1 signal recognition particle [Metallosphaera sedula]AKV76971.1 signal recognition particle [Metallosphaera sedula]AK